MHRASLHRALLSILERGTTLLPSAVFYLLAHLAHSDASGTLDWPCSRFAAELGQQTRVMERARAQLVTVGWLVAVDAAEGRGNGRSFRFQVPE